MRTARKREMAAVAAALRRECALVRTLFISWEIAKQLPMIQKPLREDAHRAQEGDGCCRSRAPARVCVSTHTFYIIGNCKATSHDTKIPPGGCALRARGRWLLSQPRVVAYAFMENNKRRMTNLKEEERWRNFYLLLNQ